MSRRHPAPGTPEWESQGGPGGPRPRAPLLPRLETPEARAARAAASSAWWQDREPEPEPGVSAGTPDPRLPSLPSRVRRAAPRRGAPGALLLPPLPPPGASGRPGNGSAHQDAVPAGLGSLLGELLPSKFREFLHQLRAKCAEPAELHTQHPKGVSEHSLGSSQCPNCSFLPNLWDQTSHLQNSLGEKFTLGPPRGEFTPAKRANHRNHSTQAPKVKAVLIHSPSGEGSRPRRRYCPFRVRFEDETVQDTALRYWERNRAVRQNIFHCEQTTLPAVSVSERVLGSVGRWLESLPRTLRPRAQDSVTGSSCWDCPRLPAQEPQVYLSEDASMNSSLPFIPRAATPRPRGPLRTFLDTPNTMDQVGKSPCSWKQKRECFLPNLVLKSILKQGNPKVYQLLLPSTTRRQAQR